MLVTDVMTTHVIKVSPENSVRRAAETMLAHHVSGLPVVDDDNRLVGMISEGDLIRRTEMGAGVGFPTDGVLSADEKAQAYVRHTSWKVGDAMSRDPITVDEFASVLEVAKLMAKHSIKRIPILRAGEIVGIVSRADLLQLIVNAAHDGTAPGDEAIRRSVIVRLGEITGLEGQVPDVSVSDGVVHLSGDLASEACRRAVRVAAEGVRGVRGVAEHYSQGPS
ncbi:CBS domain-containing protein [Sinorhizobium sp. BG8]|uniref:CBS domain-containing protein n=1 Tax=Sinorhizobium sp. BG8 TaxID=2613773 RepID=UPI00193DCF11|nr:CBS domain-containing protein [Sinorhizobium sp. BG8]QRM55466.1 CBS domain-containing protein [Sinorhizobium sp. BG8]